MTILQHTLTESNTLTDESRIPEVLRKQDRVDPFRATVRDILWAMSKGHCWYCGDDLTESWIIEHIVPVSAGGTYAIQNLAPSCRSCNSLKSNKTLEEFRILLAVKLNGPPKFTEDQRVYLKEKYGIEPECSEDDLNLRFWFETEMDEAWTVIR